MWHFLETCICKLSQTCHGRKATDSQRWINSYCLEADHLFGSWRRSHDTYRSNYHLEPRKVLTSYEMQDFAVTGGKQLNVAEGTRPGWWINVPPKGIRWNTPSPNHRVPTPLLCNCHGCELAKLLHTLKFSWKCACWIWKNSPERWLNRELYS